MPQEQQKPVSKKSDSVEDKIEDTIEKVADDLQVALPIQKSNPFGVRIITLLTLLGGVAIVGGVFADSYSLYRIHVGFYFFRLFIGFLLIFIAFGLNHKKLYAIWLLGVVVLLGLLLNPIISFLPIIAVWYLYKRRDLFMKSGEFKYKNLVLKI